MSAMTKSLTGAPSTRFTTWDSIDWNYVKKQVRRLQIRIAKAIKNGQHGKAKSLQWLLTHSFSAKLLAVKRVTSNKGGKTPGVDNVVWNTSIQKMKAAKSLSRRKYHPQPLRRIYILKSNGKKRPLGVPTMICRSQQSLYLLALEPISESIIDRNSYGFRPKRSCADAIEQCFNIFARKTSSRYVLEGDISSCFDNICHEWLLEHIPMDKLILKKWLKCGFIEKGILYPTNQGNPQGGIASPTLLNLTLRGLEAKVASVTKRSDQVNVVIYADDFVVSGNSKEILENKVKPAIEEFLYERGLLLSEEKTVITTIDDGFDFLGFNIRKYNGKLLIKPSKKNINTFLRGIRETIKSHPTCKTENLIRLLNPKIRGWANYFRHVVSKNIYSKIDHLIFWALWYWAKRRHPNRSKQWIWNKYFLNPSTRKGTLAAQILAKNGNGHQTISLINASSTLIRRHVKIKADANPYDLAHEEYFTKRSMKVKPEDNNDFSFTF